MKEGADDGSNYNDWAFVREDRELAKRPIKLETCGLWDLEIRIWSHGALSRVSSVNHSINLTHNTGKSHAIVSLNEKVDRSLVPS